MKRKKAKKKIIQVRKNNWKRLFFGTKNRPGCRKIEFSNYGETAVHGCLSHCPENIAHA